MPTKAVSYSNLYEGLKTIQPDGTVPETRMQDPLQVRDIVTRAIRYDMTIRDYKRSRLSGLVQGNPPYRASDLASAARADECNVNWRKAKRFLEGARGMVYDVFSEAETYSTVVLSDRVKDNDAKGRIVTEEFQSLLLEDIEHDFTAQQSQGQMVMFGTGPQLFSDEYDFRTISIESKSLFVPEFASSNVNRWEWAAVVLEYTPDRLFSRIVNPEMAQRRGWNVPATRRAIMNAHPLTRTGVMYQNWSWHQDLLKNGTFYYADQSKKVRLAYFYYREFPREGEEDGRITEGIIDLDSFTAADSSGKLEYLYLGLRKYERWQNVIHPMYWNHDINGYHHSVTGLGIEMYSALEYDNRLLCRLADDAFAPKLFFKPTTASEREKMSIASFGRYGVLPASLEMIQQHVQPFLQDGLAMRREVAGVVEENLSQFRSQAMMKDQGNPITAAQVQYQASEAAKMGKTQLTRIWEQYDWLYQEKYDRAISCPAGARGGKLAQAFVQRCQDRGVTKEELAQYRSVRATRTVGQGSAFMRQQALEFLLGLVVMLPEAGRANLIKEVIASRAGQSKVESFYPDPQTDTSLAAQESDAKQQVSAMTTGIPPVFVPTQNPMLYAQTFLQAAMGAMQAVQQGGDPHNAVSFVGLALPAIEQHMARMKGDKTREGQLNQMGDQVAQLQNFHDTVNGQLQQQAQKQAQAQQQMAQVQQGTDPETQVGLAKVQSAHQVKMVKTQGDLQLKAQKQQADLGLAAQRQSVENALKDATTAHGLKLNRIETAAQMAGDHAQTMHGLHLARAETASKIHLDHAKAAAAKTNGSVKQKAKP